jgi:glycosyltransferase involved in cell wall biosynthesis
MKPGEAKYQVLVICPFPEGVAAGQRLKYEQYFDSWRARGYEITVSSYMNSAMWQVVYKKGYYLSKILGVLRGHVRRLFDLLRIARYDVVYVFMWVTPFGTTTMERLVRKLSRRLIYDVEDNIVFKQTTVPQDDNPNPLISLLKGPRKSLYLIRKSDYVISSSPFLNEFCLGVNERQACSYISSSIDTDRFKPKGYYSNDRPVVIGWTGTFSSKIYLDLLRLVFQKLARRVPFKLKIIGNFDYSLPGIDLEVVRWTREREIVDLQSFDIGVYPLPVNDWVLGKSGLKAIQYMAFGLPIVATNVGTTPLLIKNGVNGLLVNSETEWIEALEQLVICPQLRRRIGESARQTAVECYSIKAVAKDYYSVLKKVTEEFV